MLNKIKIVILGKDYTLQTEEPSSYVYGLAKMLETQMKEKMEKGASQYNAAIMTALSAMDDLNRSIARLDDEAGKIRIERDAVVKENDVLKSRIAELENELRLLKLKDKS